MRHVWPADILFFAAACDLLVAAEPAATIRIGMIGLDTPRVIESKSQSAPQSRATRSPP